MPHILLLSKSKSPDDIAPFLPAETIISHIRNHREIAQYHGKHVDGAAIMFGDMRAQDISAMKGLGIIANFGVGYDNIDAVAAARAGILVTNTPDVLSDEVADAALGLLLMTLREMGQAEQYLRRGEWQRNGNFKLSPLTMRNRRVGILGLGRIGKAIAKRLMAFDVAEICYFGRQKQANVVWRQIGRAHV